MKKSKQIYDLSTKIEELNRDISGHEKHMENMKTNSIFQHKLAVDKLESQKDELTELKRECRALCLELYNDLV